MDTPFAICMGTGEIGKPLYELISGVFNTLPVDPIHFPGNELTACSILHVCIPGNIRNFNEIIIDAAIYTEALFVVVHSTVIPGTIDAIQDKLTVPVIHSPVQGKHAGNQMKKDMLRYPKYLGVPETLTEKQEEELVGFFELVGFADVRVIRGVGNVEWQKVLATSFFGYMIAWAQEVERICDEFNLNYEAVTDTFKHIEDIIPPHYPGVIGGHCVMQNIELISKIHDSEALAFIKKSNDLKKKRDGV